MAGTFELFRPGSRWAVGGIDSRPDAAGDQIHRRPWPTAPVGRRAGTANCPRTAAGHAAMAAPQLVWWARRRTWTSVPTACWTTRSHAEELPRTVPCPSRTGPTAAWHREHRARLRTARRAPRGAIADHWRSLVTRCLTCPVTAQSPSLEGDIPASPALISRPRVVLSDGSPVRRTPPFGRLPRPLVRVQVGGAGRRTHDSVPTFVASGVFHCCDYSDYYLAQQVARRFQPPHSNA